MKKTLIAACVATVMMTGSVIANETSDNTQMSPDDQLSYSLGMMIGERILKEYSEDINYYILLEGIRAQHNDEKTALTMDQAHEALQASEDRAIAAEASEAIAKGKAYLEENKARDGVTVTESGLQYEVVTAAEGDKPAATDKVTVHYKGTLLDGTTFDSSYDRGEPVEFALNHVIPGWTEGVQLMSPGSKFRFVIPSELAYGPNGAGASIGPSETLIFDVELIQFEKVEAEPAAEQQPEPETKPADDAETATETNDKS